MSAPTRPRTNPSNPRPPRAPLGTASATAVVVVAFLRDRVLPGAAAIGRPIVHASAGLTERLAAGLRSSALIVAGMLARAEEAAAAGLARAVRGGLNGAERGLTFCADGLRESTAAAVHALARVEHALAMRLVDGGTGIVEWAGAIPGRVRSNREAAAARRRHSREVAAQARDQRRLARKAERRAGLRVGPLTAVFGTGSLMTGALVWTLALALVVVAAGEGLWRTAANAVTVSVEAPTDTVLPALAQRSTIHAADNAMLGVVQDDVYRVLIPLRRVPLHVQQAVIAAEDRRFYDHQGYDVEGIGRAMVANFRAGSISQGGSTITQQLAKANFVGDERSLERKLSELAYAVGLEQRLSKEELLERYLNQVYFGAGAYGIAAAAEIYFGAATRELTVDQAAMLAGLIRSPGLSPRSDVRLVTERRDQVLASMGEMGFLPPEQAVQLQALPLRIKPRQERKIREPYFFQGVKTEFLDNADPAFVAAFGAPRSPERAAALSSGGLQIVTTLQPRLQEIADEQIAEQFGGREDGRTGAIAAVDPRNGAVVALHGGDDFESNKFNVALQGHRQPGSAMKPFVYAAAIEQGIPMNTRLAGGSTTFDIPGSTEPYPVQNFGGASYGDPDMRDALVNSVNTAAVDLFLRVGKERVLNLVERLGVDVEAAVGPTDGPSIAVGGVAKGITPLEMASAYGTFANGGQHVRPHLIDRVLGSNGEVRYAHAPAPGQVLDPQVNAAMVDMMGDVVEGGTGTAANLSEWQEAGKTGTTQSAKDAWFVGYTPVLSTAVWMGHIQPEPMSGATGGGIPASLWNDFMSQALENVEPVNFPAVPFNFGEDKRGDRFDRGSLRGMGLSPSERRRLAEFGSRSPAADTSSAAPSGDGGGGGGGGGGGKKKKKNRN